MKCLHTTRCERESENSMCENTGVIYKEAVMAPSTKMYRVSLSGPPMKFGGLGTAATSWGSGKIVAATADEAIAIAREQCAEKFDARYAKGRARVEELHRFAVKVIHRDDKRKRSTFIIVAASEREAVQYARYTPSVNRVAGYNLKKQVESVVQV